MARSPQGKHVRIDPNNPEAVGMCDRSGFLYMRKDLVKQMEWRGNDLVWTGFFVGRDQLDVPNQQSRTPILKPDPVPVKDPRPPRYVDVLPPPKLLEELQNTRWPAYGQYTAGPSEAERLKAMQNFFWNSP
jgi:hypothetical protein